VQTRRTQRARFRAASHTVELTFGKQGLKVHERYELLVTDLDELKLVVGGFTYFRQCQ
jgi:hypothetical protein